MLITRSQICFHVGLGSGAGNDCFCFVLSAAQGDKHTQELVECQRALVRAFEGRSSGNTINVLMFSYLRTLKAVGHPLGAHGLDGYAAMP